LDATPKGFRDVTIDRDIRLARRNIIASTVPLAHASARIFTPLDNELAEALAETDESAAAADGTLSPR
jgi:hypothetical protein